MLLQKPGRLCHGLSGKVAVDLLISHLRGVLDRIRTQMNCFTLDWLRSSILRYGMATIGFQCSSMRLGLAEKSLIGSGKDLMQTLGTKLVSTRKVVVLNQNPALPTSSLILRKYAYQVFRSIWLKFCFSIFWQNDSTGINQRPDFWTTVATKMHVYREDVVRLTEDSVVLEEHELHNVDAIVCATGWRPSYETFFEDSLAQDLGLSVSIDSASSKNKDSGWEAADKAADGVIAQRFPRLLYPPLHHAKVANLSPFRLHRNMLPTNATKYPGIVFLGHIVVGNNFRAAEVQALWAAAYLSGAMKAPNQAEMERSVALNLAWCRRRYLSKGQLGHWLYYDLVPYTDTLLADIGVRSHRRRGWLRDFVTPCVAADLEGLLEELKGKKGQKES